MEYNNLDKFLKKVNAGEMAYGTCVTFADCAVTEMAAEVGFDFVWIDGEHGEMDRVTAMHHLMAVKGTNTASFYRVPACDHTEIKKVIDFAPAGIIVPMVMDEVDAAKAVAACRYPMDGGNRGCGFRRGWEYGARDVSEYLNESAHDPLVILQLEHIDAARRIDKILEVPGIDSILVGPYDFSMSMGKPGEFDDPEVSAAINAACRKIVEKGVLLGAYAESDFDAWKARGVRYLGIVGDTGAMLGGFRAALSAARRKAQRCATNPDE